MWNKNIIAVALLAPLAACDWVDSTGRSGNSAPTTNISFANGVETDASQLNELSSTVLVVRAEDSDGDVNQFEWQEQPVTEGRLAQCEALPDYNPDFAVDSLEQACSSDANCRVIISQELTEGDTVDFLVSAPKLRANVGVEFELVATDNEGGVGRQRSTFCLIAINEAPNAVEDSFTVLEGDTLTVGADTVNLLSNDTDDEHIGNQGALTVLSEPSVQPSLARSLTLEENGGFTYVASALTGAGAEMAIDTFVYTVSDGSQQSEATVTVRVLAKNDPPELLDVIAEQNVVAGIPFESDLSANFNDAEGAALSFTLAEGSLPSSGGLTLTPMGLLSGTAELIDIGNYPIQIIASDGGEIVSADVNIVVEDNLPVEALVIAAQTLDVGETLTLDISDFFDDPENQTLEFSVDTSYDNAELTIDATTGEFEASFEDAGRYTVDVSASDGVSAASSIRFVVNVNSDNVAPIFRGTIPNRLVEFGSALTPISGTFVDANALTYSVIGTLPDGLSINGVGVISGRPTETGIFRGIRIVATDPFDAFARSNAFVITVNGPVARPVNIAPVFRDSTTVFNQGLLLGRPITPLEPDFFDADGDTLSYSVIGGVLPDGVVINSRTGVVSGTPTEADWVLGLIILATDPSGASATSDEFWIRVR